MPGRLMCGEFSQPHGAPWSQPHRYPPWPRWRRPRAAKAAACPQAGRGDPAAAKRRAQKPLRAATGAAAPGERTTGPASASPASARPAPPAENARTPASPAASPPPLSPPAAAARLAAGAARLLCCCGLSCSWALRLWRGLSGRAACWRGCAVRRRATARPPPAADARLGRRGRWSGGTSGRQALPGLYPSPSRPPHPPLPPFWT
mmetsp:Transcript_42574/g.137226  ORF Transcript_42574/g.137226 Transcript_42574/m.137226 type:complete len:205 (-) Transcript_42574:73-687(-)